MNDATDPKKNAADDNLVDANTDRRVLRFSELSCGKSELLIEHHGQTYLLRVTKNGKLLLNK